MLGITSLGLGCISRMSCHATYLNKGAYSRGNTVQALFNEDDFIQPSYKAQVDFDKKLQGFQQYYRGVYEVMFQVFKQKQWGSFLEVQESLDKLSDADYEAKKFQARRYYEYLNTKLDLAFEKNYLGSRV